MKDISYGIDLQYVAIWWAEQVDEVQAEFLAMLTQELTNFCERNGGVASMQRYGINKALNQSKYLDAVHDLRDIVGFDDTVSTFESICRRASKRRRKCTENDPTGDHNGEKDAR